MNIIADRFNDRRHMAQTARDFAGRITTHVRHVEGANWAAGIAEGRLCHQIQRGQLTAHITHSVRARVTDAVDAVKC